jgi:predicted negative regulator of RcsB-dependent stress response
LKEKVSTPAFVAAIVVVLAIAAFAGWKFLGPKSSGASTSTSADMRQKMDQMNQMQMQQRNKAQQMRPGYTSGGSSGMPPGYPGGGGSPPGPPAGGGGGTR